MAQAISVYTMQYIDISHTVGLSARLPGSLGSRYITSTLSVVAKYRNGLQ